jgi:pimeloyl-ACP methyl ester carboxylesterase
VKTFDHNSGEYLQLDGARIYYEVTGNNDGPTLLLLHGGFGNCEYFNPILPHLKRQFKIVGIDSRGQGKSTGGSVELNYEQLQKDVERVISHLGLTRFGIIGFSDGGIVGYRLASFTSLPIEKLVTIGSRWHVKNTEPNRNLFLSINPEGWKAKFPTTFHSYQKLNPEPDFDSLVPALVRMWLDPSASGSPNEAVKNISCPVLIVRGDTDPILSLEAVVELSRLVKDSAVLNIPFAGHSTLEDQLEMFMLGLNEFLDS